MPVSSSAYFKALTKYFYANRDELSAHYHGKFAVINEFEVKATFDVMIDAVAYGVRNFGWGQFIVQQCLTEEELPPIHLPYSVQTIDDLP